MSFSLKIKDGDIQLRGSQVGIVYGPDKLKQDLTLWLTERYRTDRFHVTYGSTLDNYIGEVIEQETPREIESEVSRVLQNYQALQYRRMTENSSKLSADEILVSVRSIRAKVQYDAVIVTIEFTTGARGSERLTVGLSL